MSERESRGSRRTPADGGAGRTSFRETGKCGSIPEQEGDLHLSLDGTLVSGDYTLEGGFTGSVRGTLVADRLKLDRVDSRLGLNAVYYGRVSRDGSSLTGTWESMDVSGGAPSSGTWSARKQPSDQEEK